MRASQRIRAVLGDARLPLLLGLIAVAYCAYLPVLGAGFINWDDPVYVTMNPHLRVLSWGTVGWALRDLETAGLWHPLTWLSLALDYRLYGLSARGFHLTNLVLHAADTGLLFLVLARMTGAPWRSALVAALFALHPMHVESVAWITERKDVLCAFFWILTMGAYARYARTGTVVAYGLVFVLSAAAIASKPMAVTLPFVLLLLDVWPLARLSWRAVGEKVPLALPAVALAVYAIGAGGEALAAAPVGAGDRIANALFSFVKYLGLTLWPVGLSPWYSHPALEGPPLAATTVAACATLLAVLTALAFATVRTRPYQLVGWLWFLGTLVPALGLVQAGRQGMADRFAYIPHIGLFIAIVWTLADAPVWRTWGARIVGAAAAATVLVVLAFATDRQTRVWHDSHAFWEYAARTSPYSFVAHQGFAGVLFQEGRRQDALAEYRIAVSLRPGVAPAHSRLGLLYLQTGRPGPAAAQYRKAIAANPRIADDYVHLAEALLARGHRRSAAQQLARALALRPNHPDARRLLAATAEASS